MKISEEDMCSCQEITHPCLGRQDTDGKEEMDETKTAEVQVT